MKNNKLIVAGILGLFFYSGIGYAQTDQSKEAWEYLSVNSGVQKIDKKVLEDPYQQAITYVALKFRSASVGTIQEGKTKNITTAKSYAILDGIDSTVFQSITNEFYKIFIEKLKSARVKLVDLEKIKASERYRDFVADKSGQRYFNHKQTGTATVYSQNNDPFFDMPSNVMKIMKYQNEVDGGVSNLRLTVDFVEFDMSIHDVHHDYFNASDKTTHASAKILPGIKITSDWVESTGEALTGLGAYNLGGFVMSNKKCMSVLFSCQQPVFTPFAADVTSFEGKTPEFAKKHSLFGGGAMELGTFVVKPDPEAFRKAAIEGLTRYADYIVAIIKSYN